MRSNFIIVASSLIFTMVSMVTWVDMGGGRYNFDGASKGI